MRTARGSGRHPANGRSIDGPTLLLDHHDDADDGDGGEKVRCDVYAEADAATGDVHDDDGDGDDDDG